MFVPVMVTLSVLFPFAATVGVPVVIAVSPLTEERALDRPLQTRVIRLSYARAAEVASLLKKYLSPRGDVAYDARTNTLFVTDIE